LLTRVLLDKVLTLPNTPGGDLQENSFYSFYGRFASHNHYQGKQYYKKKKTPA
jgi:hypothetical protein